jgi:ABC-2 type transport system ATP-binding protein
MKLIAGLNKTNEGRIEVDGSTDLVEKRAMISFMDDLSGFDKKTKVSAIVEFYRDNYPDFNADKYAELAEFMKLTTNESYRALSLGNKMKLQITLALSREAKVYLLDEPFNGIDILTREAIIKALVKWFSEDSVILLSTHHPAEIENVVDDLVILKDGKIITHSTPDELREAYGLGIEDYYREVYAHD